MTNLPRSRALVQLDGPGHIMPVEPVTPPDSTAWRIIHLPVTLAAVAASVIVVAAFAINPAEVGLQLAIHVPGARYLLPLVAAGAISTLYWAFVRFVERRRDVEELGGRGWAKELGLGIAGGLALSLAPFVILALSGSLRVVGFNSLRVMVLPSVIQLCTAIILELLYCGLLFRLIERLLGSWLAVLVIMVGFGVVQLSDVDEAPLTALASAIDAGLLFAALYMVTRRLWAVIGLHLAWKLAQIGLYGAAMSPAGPFGFVVSRLRGPDWLTGGGAGTNSSVPAILIDALVIVVLLTVAARRGQIVRPAWRRGRRASASGRR